MESIVVSLINVGVVLLAVVLAIYLWIKPKPVFNAMMVLVMGVSIYSLDIILQINNGVCVFNEGNGFFNTLGVLDDCLDAVSKHVFAAQVMILGSAIAIFFTPLLRLIKRDIEKMKKDEESSSASDRTRR